MRKKDEADETTAMDPIALTLAVWLGLIACAGGLARMSDNAAAMAATAQQAEMRTGGFKRAEPGMAPIDALRTYGEQIMATGG